MPTVKDLLTALAKCDPDAEVILYCGVSEDADAWGGEVINTTHATADRHVTTDDDSDDASNRRPYVKGDWPDWHGPGITGSCFPQIKYDRAMDHKEWQAKAYPHAPNGAVVILT